MEKPIKDLLNFSIINIDKPTGPTSFTVSQFVKRGLKLSKTTHLGTLDPMVTGVLPVGLGRACKLSGYFMGSDKKYIGIMRLHSDISLADLKKEMKEFIGTITQLPPVRSRVKRARRERTIKKFEILEKNGKDVLFVADVQAGTYIRKLIHDLGEKIGGAHMLELRRTRAGIFTEDKLYTLYDFEKALKDEKALRKMLVPAEEAIKKVMPAVQIEEESLKQILTGRPLMKPDIKDKLPKEEIFAIFLKERFVAIMRKKEDGDIIAKAEFVFN